MGCVRAHDEIEVTVDKGWVTLKLEVEWQYRREDAERSFGGCKASRAA
jgi:hypothetical protein